MLQHSRAKPGERQMTDINALLEENLNLAYHGMRAQDSGFTITIERDFAPDLVKLPVVSQDISRVFLNVITNGFYAAYRKKKDNLPSAPGFIPTLSLRTRNIGEGVEVRIRDNGTGIPLALHKKRFTPFFTTKPAGQGTGLGLSLSHDIIVKGHRGEIAFETEEGQYTEFIITLPKQEAVQPQWT
jgi:signal transduction histidine kinase